MFTVWSDHNKVAGTFNAISTLLLPTLRDLFLRQNIDVGGNLDVGQNIDVGGIDKWPLCRITSPGPTMVADRWRKPYKTAATSSIHLQ